MCGQTVNNRPNANLVLTLEKNGVYYNQSRGCDKYKKGKRKMNVLKLKGKMVEKGWKVAPLAEYVGMDKSTLYKKLKRHLHAGPP